MADVHNYPSLRDIDNSYASGKAQMDFVLRPEKGSGLTSVDIARQIRGAFGAEGFT